MSDASTRSIDPALLDGQPALSFRHGPYHYEIARRGDLVFESVAYGQSSLSRPLLFAFGKGIVGRTCVYQILDTFYESHVSYYSAIQGLDFTNGHPQVQSNDLAQALGRPLESEEAQKRFGCHTTASTTSNHFNPSQSFEGVTCEACHGPGCKHVHAMMLGHVNLGKRSITNPGKLDAGSSVDFCRASHRTFGDVLQMNVPAVPTVRFQPFRLEESRCWARAQGRLTCLTCHNPHSSLVQDMAYYDPLCLSCHSRSSTGRAFALHSAAVVCKIAREECTGCHMLKVEISGMHRAFTDHWIRIQTRSSAYPI